MALASGVSAATVSKVLSGRGDYAVQAQTAERVRQVALELGYVPDMAAKHLRTRRTGQIGVILEAVGASEPETALGQEAASAASALRSTFDGAIMAGLSGAARDYHVPALVVYPGSALPARSYLDGRVNGLIVSCDPLRGHALLSALEHTSLPVVALWTQQVPGGIRAVDVDHALGAAQAVGHLLDLGHTRIAFYGGGINSGVEHFARREAGYRQTLSAAGLAYLPALHGAAALLEAVRRGRVSAVFAETDLAAAAVHRALSRAGLNVPGDLSLVGFDNLQGAEYIAGGLTTIDHPAAAMAAEGVRILIEQLAGGGQSEFLPVRSLIAPHLIVRRSTQVYRERPT